MISSKKHKCLLGFSFFVDEYSQLLDAIKNYINNKKNCFIITPTTEILWASYRDSKMRKILNSATVLLPDSITLVGLGKLLGRDFNHRLTGIDVMYQLGQDKSTSYKVFYLGTKKEILEKAIQNSADILPSFQVVGSHDGFYKIEDESEIVAQINKSAPDILFVGTGFPKQEEFVYNNLNKLKVPVKITVGGSFDVLAGVFKRAPLFFRKCGIEWVYRLLQQPSRIKRMYKIPWYLIEMYWYERNNKND